MQGCVDMRREVIEPCNAGEQDEAGYLDQDVELDAARRPAESENEWSDPVWVRERATVNTTREHCDEESEHRQQGKQQGGVEPLASGWTGKP